MDSNAKTKSGFLSGDYVDFGKWDQCMETVYQDSSDPSFHFTGKYCLSKWHLPSPESSEEWQELQREFNDTWPLHSLLVNLEVSKFLAITNGICFPSTCSGREINQIMQFYLDQEEIPLRVEFEKHCDVPDDFTKPYSSYPWWKQLFGYVHYVIFESFNA